MSDIITPGDSEVFVDAVDDLRQALPDEDEDEFHDATDADAHVGAFETIIDDGGDKVCDHGEGATQKSKEEIEQELLEKREREESELTAEETEKRFNEGQRLKAEGNDIFKNQEFDEAIAKYSEALDICPLSFVRERSIMFSNRGACYVKKKEFESALEDCNKAIKLHPQYVKCLHRRAEVHEELDKLDEALEDYQGVLKLDQSNGAARMKCMILPEKIRERNEKLKAEMLGQLKNLGNMVLKPFGLSTDNFQCVQDPNTGGYSVNFKQ